MRFPIRSASQTRFTLMSLLLALSIGLSGAAVARAQTADPAGQPAAAGNQAGAGVKPGAEEASNDQFRHAPIVQLIARTLHLSTESAAEAFEDINSAVLILLIAFAIFKVLPKALRNRSATIQKQLIEARAATETANERLTAVEARLARLGQDIDAIRQQTERDLLEDEKRIKHSLEEEKDKIVKSAEQEIESAGAAAQRELKRFAAELSIDRAAARIQMSADSDRALIGRFGKDLVALASKDVRGQEGRN